jgi:hypothetical protein
MGGRPSVDMVPPMRTLGDEVAYCVSPGCGRKAEPGREECYACARGMFPDLEQERARVARALAKARRMLETSPAVRRARRIAERRRLERRRQEKA